MSWEECTLGDVVTLKRGHDLPNAKRVPGNVPVVSSSGFTGQHNEAKAEPPGVVTGRYGTIGEVFYVTEPYWPLNTALYAIDFHGNDPRFVSYFLRNQLRNYQSDKAAVPGVDRNVLHKLPARCPDPQIQQQIVSILSAYDDLIENNRRRIALLEEAARLLYREWFVHFRFPGHEHVKIIDGVPEGWEQLTISEVCVVGRGASPRPIQKYIGGDVPWFKIGDATASLSAFVFETKEHVIPEGAAKSVRLPKGALILSNSATCGVPNFTGVEGCIHDGWLYFKGLTRVNKLFLFLYLEQQQKALLQGIGDGATQKNLNTDYVGKQKFRIPSDNGLLETFDQVVAPIFEQIERLARLSLETAKACDLLLPRLMDGRLEV